MENQWDEEQNQAKFNIIPVMNRDICNKMEYGFPKDPKSFQKENKTAILENRNLAKNRNSATTGTQQQPGISEKPSARWSVSLQ